MKNKVDLSVIVPIYNVEKYLEECLNSVYSLNISKEIILVNDGSIDNSLKIAEKYKNKYPEETILISQTNKGQSEARNTGLNVASGEYIYFLDSDDFIETEQFERFFRGGGRDIDIIHGTAFEYYEEKKEKLHKNKVPHLENIILNGKDFILKMYENKAYTEAIWVNIYRKDFLKENKILFKEGLLYEDTLFSLIIFSKAKKIKYLGTTIYNYRQEVKGSIMSKPRNYIHTLFIIDKLLDYSSDENISSKEISDYFVSQIKDFAKRQKIFNEEIYQKLWDLKIKSFKVIRKLVETRIRSYFCKKINYEDIINLFK